MAAKQCCRCVSPIELHLSDQLSGNVFFSRTCFHNFCSNMFSLRNAQIDTAFSEPRLHCTYQSTKKLALLLAPTLFHKVIFSRTMKGTVLGLHLAHLNCIFFPPPKYISPSFWHLRHKNRTTSIHLLRPFFFEHHCGAL